MGQRIHIQKISRRKQIPSTALLKKWILHTLKNKSAEITLRIVGAAESQKLNHHYRDKNYPTNILSFPYQSHPIEGDMVLCAPLITSKAEWAHLIVHGTLHLMGYDHETPQEAFKMESREIKLLAQLGFDNPYKE